jgi:phage tail sheath protein FI
MATLVSPGVSTSVNNQSFFIPGTSSTLPLFFIATRANKTQTDGVTPAAGTAEYGVVRTVTSISQSLELYGVPYFVQDSSGNQFHGDARNEYGLFALNQYLGTGARAYVVRANIDLDDTPETFISLGTPVYQPASLVYNGIGNGTLGSVSAYGPAVKPQQFTVTFTSSTSFSVQGSTIGYVGTGVAGIPFASTSVAFTISAGSTAFAAGDKFIFTVGYAATADSGNTGNGVISGLVPDTLAVPEVFTVEMTSPTAFQVTGTVSGVAGTGVVGTAFDNNRINFLLSAGSTPFVATDAFTITVQSVTISNPLGANDAARRLAIVTALQAAINSNTEVRSDLYEFNLVACPGYWEATDELAALSVDVKSEAMVVAPCPSNLTPEQVAQWALTSNRVYNENVAYYYSWGLASNIDGTDVLVCPSGIALRTIAYSDQQAYVWIAPAGTQRGVVSGVSKMGYVTGTLGTATTFVEATLNDGQRDNLYEYDKNINPITYIIGRGILVWGQKTSAPAASALDRINVVRLVMYLRRSLRKGALPFVFEPNDSITRDNLKAASDGMLNDILTKRGLYDFASVCDTTNNTADRIDRNELYLDVYIKPTKAAEFIYVQINVLTTGADL